MDGACLVSNLRSLKKWGLKKNLNNGNLLLLLTIKNGGMGSFYFYSTKK